MATFELYSLAELEPIVGYWVGGKSYYLVVFKYKKPHLTCNIRDASVCPSIDVADNRAKALNDRARSMQPNTPSYIRRYYSCYRRKEQ